ncbi:DASH complex subunit Dad1-domain-containing protein [Dendryphion nanum]|uniref:DASH complex subunit DAD1 n=1 Tax=Dendryphion nanum TaxID=256645 RepID=A0A9P9IDY4_9PLEO|nr:DASH complex subunit Dad1-domain-containing protein [Dendryphion nanum]
MSSHHHAPRASTLAPQLPEKSYFEQQRELLSLEHVLQNMNKLNRSLEEVIAVGKEFSPVEALWSQFENVMAKDTETGEGEERGDAGGEETEYTEVEK